MKRQLLSFVLVLSLFSSNSLNIIAQDNNDYNSNNENKTVQDDSDNFNTETENIQTVNESIPEIAVPEQTQNVSENTENGDSIPKEENNITETIQFEEVSNEEIENTQFDNEQVTIEEVSDPVTILVSVNDPLIIEERENIKLHSGSEIIKNINTDFAETKEEIDVKENQSENNSEIEIIDVSENEENDTDLNNTISNEE